MPIFTNEVLVDNTVLVDGSAVTQPVSGTVAVSSVAGSVAVTGTFFQATQPVSGTVSISGSVAVTGPLTDTQLRATPVPVSGTVSVIAGGTALATVSRVAVTNTAAATLSASNSGKVKVVIYNEGGTLFVKLGSTASSTDYSYTMTANSTLEVTDYYGIITARKNSGSTFAQVTEVGI